MKRGLHAIALHPLQLNDFLDLLLYGSIPSTHLIICVERDAFLDGLETSIRRTHQEESSNNTHKYLTSKLHLVAASRNITLAFTPTVPHLRVHLAKLSAEGGMLPNDRATTERAGYLAIWSLITVHRSTSDFSAQGMSRTLAIASEAADSQQRRLLLAEPPLVSLDGNPEGVDIRNSDPWREAISLLSESIRFNTDDRLSNGRIIEVQTVVQKWCTFVKLESVRDNAAEDDTYMVDAEPAQS